MINGIFDEKLKKIHMIFFELLPFFKIMDPEILGPKFCIYDIQE